MRQIKRVLAIKSLALHGRDCYFFMNEEAEASFLAQGKSWLKFFQSQTQVTSQISRAANWQYHFSY